MLQIGPHLFLSPVLSRDDKDHEVFVYGFQMNVPSLRLECYAQMSLTGSMQQAKTVSRASEDSSEGLLVLQCNSRMGNIKEKKII